ncbi:hypothetical protein TGAM01_v206318 [Trichoderma gamsii]|uniref:AA1-like domain-containing protein n=1 Tax=Trichoderma gamsii TaxID=398673 RepID=A0A2P4ZKK2_9HYPO|nr:hypothetical protein TGAM01_v206318 [Trichoderma gamsii]PON24810.1 hypothetical protein TGAM01_v206318 [Trichoderma gamsii]
MKTSAFATTVFSSLAAAASPYWYITNLQSLDTTSPTGESTLQFTFEDASTSLVTNCSYVNVPGSARPVTVLTPTPCENSQVLYTYIKTSQKTGQFNITLQHLNAAGNLQGNQYGLGIADLACQADEAQGSTACFAANTEIIPGPETGA